MPQVAITEDLYKKIRAQAREEGISVSKLVERLLVEETKTKIDICPRCAFRF